MQECTSRWYCFFPERCVVDLGFILDQSTSIELDGRTGVFKKIILQFVKNAANKYGITKDGVRAGVIVYSHVLNTKVKIHLDDCYDTICFTEAVDKIEYEGGNTFTNEALKKADEELFIKKRGFRENVPTYAILIADGGQTETAETAGYLLHKEVKSRASTMKERGIKIVAFGIALSKIRDIELLETLASPGEYHNVTNFNELDTFLDDLMIGVCSGK